MRPIILLLALLLSACGSAPDSGPPPSPAAATPATSDGGTATDTAVPALPPLGEVRLLEVTLGRELDGEQRVRSAQSVFAASDPLHLSVVVGAPETALQLSARWLSGDGRLLAEDRGELAAGQPAVVTFSLTRSEPWPPGDYRVELAVNGQPVDHRAFRID